MEMTIESMFRANNEYEVHLINGDIADINLHRDWKESQCSMTLENAGDTSVRVSEVVLFKTDMPYPADTPFYGEGYNMLSQYQGTLNCFENITGYTDYGHYKLPQKAGCFTVYNMLMLFPEGQKNVLMGFSSCNRFNGEFRFNSKSLEIVLNCEGLEIAAGEKIELEEFYLNSGQDYADVLDDFARCIEGNHPLLPCAEIPTGWCSWYCYGPDVTEQDVLDNLMTIQDKIPQLKYIQIDDGYQKHMGDWLIPHENFPNGIKSLCMSIKNKGFEPAIWVAPFIAEADSELFKKHPNWFVKDDEGQPLPSNRYSFGGWRCGPWYMLDGTHPDACDYLRHVFNTMREEWGCHYFKLDANVWGALPFGNHYDPSATSVEAYRSGMKAVLEGAGDDSFVLGCNAPMWPSIGAVHGMRTTGDISRKWDMFKVLAKECFNRNWQNGSLWINDPDCIVLDNLPTHIMGPDGQMIESVTDITQNEFSFHAAHILASGGMILASDKMMNLNDGQINILKKLLPPGGKAAAFDDRKFRIGKIQTDTGYILFLFNWNETESIFSIPMNDVLSIEDYWTGELVVNSCDNQQLQLSLPARSARVLKIKEEI